MNSEFRFFPRRILEIHAESDHQGSFARQLAVHIQRIQFIVLIRKVQNSKGYFSVAAGEPISRKRVELPKVVAGFGDTISDIVLGIPNGIALGKKATRMIKDGE